jgi:hypothetical protein
MASVAALAYLRAAMDLSESGRFVVDYPVQGCLVVAHARPEGEVAFAAYFSEVYVLFAMEQLWELHHARGSAPEVLPALLLDWTKCKGPWDTADGWHAYAAAPLAAMLVDLLEQGVQEPDLSRIHPVDGRPSATVSEALAALVAFVQQAPRGEVFVMCD